MADVHADACRYTRERQYREEPWHAPKCERKPKSDPERGEHTAEQLDRALRRNCRAEHAGPKCCEAKTRDALASRLRNEQQREAEARDGTAEMREPDHRTNTAAWLTCPCSLTVSVYRPRVVGACSRSTCDEDLPVRRPRLQL